MQNEHYGRRPSSSSSSSAVLSSKKATKKSLKNLPPRTEVTKKTNNNEEEFEDNLTFEKFLESEDMLICVAEQHPVEVIKTEKPAVPKQSQFSSAVAEGEVNMKKHNWQKALNAFTRAIELGPKNKHVLVCRSKCYRNLGQFDLAIKDADTALSYDTNYYKV